MRIDRISLKDLPPIKLFDAETTSSVVIIAGANGSGKTRLKEAIVNTFRQPNRPQASLRLTATQEEEALAWGGQSLDVTQGGASNPLIKYLETRQGAKAYTGTVVQVDSNRAINPVSYETYSLATQDPDDEAVSYSYYLDAFVGRWQQLVNKIYKKVANRDQKIAKFVKDHPEARGQDALIENPDPFETYQDYFSRLLPGKALDPIDPKSPRDFHFRVGDSKPMAFSQLSSGEREVVKVAFDLIWKRLTHSIILLDEPELHLHPTLLFRLVETLKEFGGGTNQLILFTHSADLISTYYSSGNIFFIDASAAASNQAHQLSSLSIAHSSVLRAVSANLGLFAVGKRLIFVEGQDASVDRLVYHKVAQISFQDAYILPIGSVNNILALRSVVDELANAIFGIDLFLVRDRDGLSDDSVSTLEANPRFRALPRRHVENYLLDPEILSQVAAAFYLPTEKRDQDRIRESIYGIATSCVMQAVLWNVREQIRIAGSLSQASIQSVDQMTRDDLADAL